MYLSYLRQHIFEFVVSQRLISHSLAHLQMPAREFVVTLSVVTQNYCVSWFLCTGTILSPTISAMGFLVGNSSNFSILTSFSFEGNCHFEVLQVFHIEKSSKQNV